MAWTVVVPLKGGAERKSRLAPVLDARQRLDLSDALYDHVIGCISRWKPAEQLIAVSPAPIRVDPSVRQWVQSHDTLNVELEEIRATLSGPMMVVNADLPLLQANALNMLAEAAGEQGCAIAADRHGVGTNAVALLPHVPFAFSFGPQSLKLHLKSAHDGACVVRCGGLAYDLDTPEDIDALIALARPLPADVARLMRLAERKGTHAAVAAGD